MQMLSLNVCRVWLIRSLMRQLLSYQAESQTADPESFSGREGQPDADFFRLSNG